MENEGGVGALATRLRAAIYTRYSCNMSRPASLEDQERNCRRIAEEKGWTVLDGYVRSDAAKTGRKLQNRDGLNSLLAEIELKPRPFDVIVIDELSRLGRREKDVLGIIDELKFYGVKLYVVAQRLDSDDPNFKMLLNIHTIIDSQNSEHLRHRVRRGHEGVVRKGFTSGSRCFGYRSVPVLNAARPDLQGRAAIEGVKWEIIESEAATIRRIFQLYADGLSDHQITLKLNLERVPAARNPRIGSGRTFWNPSLIKRILKNEKYIGMRIWNKTRQEIHPKTEKTITRKNPPQEWLRTDVPELRIVSDELWGRVQERLKIVNEQMTARVIGGQNRAKKRDYLFSGLLTCGICGTRMIIGSSHAGGRRSASYGCPSWRYKRGCSNNLWIREDRLSSQLVAEMANNMLVPNVMDYFIDSVSHELESYLTGVGGDRGESLKDLNTKEVELKRSISMLLTAMMNPCSANSTALPEKLAELESELGQVHNNIGLLNAPKDLHAVQTDLGEIVRSNISNLLEVIKEDVPKARQVLQRHIKKLILYPTSTDNGPGYEVLGEIDLFKSPSDRHGRVLLARSGTGTVQQYTDEVDFMFRFVGLVIYADVDPGENPLVAPLTQLLESNPDLLHEPKFACEWAKLIKSVLAPGSELCDRVNDDYVAWNFRKRAKTFAEQFGMTTIVHRRMTWYMFSRPRRIEQLDGSHLSQLVNVEPAEQAA